MPFKSEKQRRFLWSQHPEIAKRWAHEYPKQENLPMYADKKENEDKEGKNGGKEAQIATARAVLRPILARFAENGVPLRKKSESILAHVEMPETDTPTYAGEKHLRVTGTSPEIPKREHDGPESLCRKMSGTQKAAEVQEIKNILRKQAIVLSQSWRTTLQPIMDAVNQAINPSQNQPAQGNGAGGMAQGQSGGAQGANGMANGANGMAQGQNSAPASPQGPFVPANVGNSYPQFLNSARQQMTQARTNAMIPPPIGSQAPAVVASFPGMNSAPQKTASNAPGSSLGNPLKSLQPISPDFQASNIANKDKNLASTGNDAILNTIGKLSTLKTVGGKVDMTAGMSGGAFGNLPNTPKLDQLG